LIFLHFARKTFTPWAGLKLILAEPRDGPCRTGQRVVGIGGRLQRPAGVEYYHVDYVGLHQRFYSAEGEMMATLINYEGLGHHLSPLQGFGLNLRSFAQFA
jgi:hypothetical protein